MTPHSSLSDPAPTSPTLQRGIVVVGLLALAVAVAAKGFSSNSALVTLLPALLPLLVFLVNRPHVWLTLAIAAFHSCLYFPSLPASLSLHYVLSAALVPFLCLRCLFLRMPAHRTSGWLRLFAFGYLAVALCTAVLRGFGLRLLGGESWGGAGYVQLSIGIPLFLLSDSLVPTRKQWTILIVLYCMAGLVPSAMEILYLLTQARFPWIYQFVQLDGVALTGNLAVVEGASGILRFQISKYVVMLFLLAMALYPYRGTKKPVIIGSFLLAVLFVGLSGHRIAAVYLVLLIPTVMFNLTGRIPMRLLLGYALLLFLLTVILHWFGHHLPSAFQRAFSWVPFADITAEARDSAMGTSSWRIEVWRRLWLMVPDYWLLGRGFIFDQWEYYSVMNSGDAWIGSVIVTHNYHNGPLSMLVDLGALGLLFGSALLLGGVARHARLMRDRKWRDPVLQRYHAVFFASYCVDVFRFYATHGDPSSTVVGFLVQLVILEGVWRTDRETAPEPLTAARSETGG